MRLRHWHAAPLGELRNADPSQRGVGAYKPAGLWLSDESAEISWSEWCRNEQFGIGSMWTDFDVDMADVLHISTERGLRKFTDIFGIQQELSQRYSRIEIDWSTVGARYKGLLITPYIWSCRLDLDWYYGWDCASGVFWDVSCLTLIERSAPLPVVSAAQRMNPTPEDHQ